jgi:hypothetical protein
VQKQIQYAMLAASLTTLSACVVNERPAPVRETVVAPAPDKVIVREPAPPPAVVVRP